MRRNQRVFVVHTCNPSKTGRVKDILSTKTGVWVNTKSKMTPLVHKMRRFCGYEQQNDANFQEKGCFLGYEGEFDDNFQEKGHFLGRQDEKI